MSKVLFEEHQRFDSMIIYVMTTFCLILASIMTYNGATMDELKVLLIPLIISIAIWYFIRMHTTVDEQGIHVRVAPLHRKHQVFKWEDINAVQIKEYRPLLDYGGYGIRHTFSKGKAYNMAGKQGVLLEMDNSNVMIGTQNPADFILVLSKKSKEHKIKYQNAIL